MPEPTPQFSADKRQRAAGSPRHQAGRLPAGGAVAGAERRDGA